jgi:GT2 family glycosyltransferase
VTLPATKAGVLVQPGEHPCSHPTPFLLCIGDDCEPGPLVQALAAHGVTVANSPIPTDQVASTLIVRLNTNAKPARAVGAVVRWQDFAGLVIDSAAEPATQRRSHPRNAQSAATQRKRWTQWRTLIDAELPSLRYVHLIRRGKNGLPDAEADPTAAQRAQDWNWIGFFTSARIRPLTIAAEDLAANPEAAARMLVASLGPEDESPADPRSWRDRAANPQTATRSGTGARRTVPAVSVIVVTHNEGENLPLTISGIRATVPDNVEVIVVDDWSTDGSVAALEDVPNGDVRIVRPAARGGVTGARNAGASAANGEVLVFADAHVDPSEGWLEALCAALSDPSVACAAPTITQIHKRQACGYGFTWREPQLRMRWLGAGTSEPHEVPFICGCLMVFRRDDFEAVGGFDAGLVRWGSEDAEIGLHLWRRGRASVVVPQARVAHLFRPAGPYDVPQHLVVHNTLRLASVHLPQPALRRVIASLCRLESFSTAYTQLLGSDVWERRDRIARSCRYDGDWFLDRFRIRPLQ